MEITLQQFHGGNGAGRTAAHAVVECDHLRHVGHGDLLAGPESRDATDEDGGRDQYIVLHARMQERDQGRDQHAGAGPDNAAACRDRRAHPLEAENEQHGRDEVTDFYDVVHQFFFPLLLLNISSMRSVTT